jgi:hypothetical protein
MKFAASLYPQLLNQILDDDHAWEMRGEIACVMTRSFENEPRELVNFFHESLSSYGIKASDIAAFKASSRTKNHFSFYIQIAKFDEIADQLLVASLKKNNELRKNQELIKKEVEEISELSEKHKIKSQIVKGLVQHSAFIQSSESQEKEKTYRYTIHGPAEE